MLGLTKERDLIPVNENPRVSAAREKTRAAMAVVAEAEAEEQRLRDVLIPPSDSATTQPKEITEDMIREANRRLIPRRFGVTDPRFADTQEGITARATLKAAKQEEATIRDEVRKELEQQVRKRVGDLCDELADALVPCQSIAAALLSLQEESGLTFPQVPSCLSFGNTANELAAVRLFAKG